MKLDNQAPPPPLSEAIDIGHLVENRWIYMGEFQPQSASNVVMDIYAANDHLRDDGGKIMLLTFGSYGLLNSDLAYGKCKTEIAARNGGRKYGVERHLRLAMAAGIYKDGDLFLPPREFLNGKRTKGKGGAEFEFVRPNNLVRLLQILPAFSQIKMNAEGGSREEKWVHSSSMYPRNVQLPYQVRLTDGDDYWPDKANLRSAVVPFCAVRRLSTKEF